MTEIKLDVTTKRRNYDGLYVYDHVGILLGKVIRYNDNYKLWRIALYDHDEGVFERPSGWYKTQKAALDEIRGLFGYEVCA